MGSGTALKNEVIVGAYGGRIKLLNLSRTSKAVLSVVWLCTTLAPLTAARGDLTPDTAEILFVGDSHALLPGPAGPASFAAIMENFLRFHGYRTRFLAATGSSPSDWLEGSPSQAGYMELTRPGTLSDRDWEEIAKKRKEPYLKTFSGRRDLMTYQALLATHRPRGVIIAQGSNLVGSLEDLMTKWPNRRLTSFKPDQIKKLMELHAFQTVREMAQLASADSRSCLWIGPPMMDRFRPAMLLLSDLIKASLEDSGCHYVASIEATSFPAAQAERYQVDGIHFSYAEGRQISARWGVSILRSQGYRSFIYQLGAPMRPPVHLPDTLQTDLQKSNAPGKYFFPW